MYWVVWFTSANLFVMGYEEPTLRHEFGPEYDAYCRQVGDGFPGCRPRFKRFRGSRVQGFKGSRRFMTVQDIELDHVFVMCAAGAPEAEALVRRPPPTPPDRHLRRFFLRDQYLELSGFTTRLSPDKQTRKTLPDPAHQTRSFRSIPPLSLRSSLTIASRCRCRCSAAPDRLHRDRAAWIRWSFLVSGPPVSRRVQAPLGSGSWTPLAYSRPFAWCIGGVEIRVVLRAHPPPPPPPSPLPFLPPARFGLLAPLPLLLHKLENPSAETTSPPFRSLSASRLSRLRGPL